MDQSNMNMESQYPDPELSQIQNTPWARQDVQHANTAEEITVGAKRSYSTYDTSSLLDWQKQFRRSFDPSPTTTSFHTPKSGRGGREEQHTNSSRETSFGIQRSNKVHDGSSSSDWQNRYPRSFDVPLVSRSFDTPINGIESEDGGGGWDRELPGDDVDDLLDGDDDDPDYRDHSAKLKKLRNDILQLRQGDGDFDFPSMLDGTSVPRPRKKAQPKEPRPRGRQLGQKVGPRKAAELSGDIKLRLATAVTFFQNEKPFEAAEALEEIIRLNAEVPEAWKLLAGIYEDAGQIDRALRCLMMAATTSPKSTAPWITAAILAESQDGPERPYFLFQAQYCYSCAIRADPKSLECRRARAAVLEERGKRNTAISEYKTIAAREPADTETLRKIAELCIDHGKCQVAIGVYKESINYFQRLPPEQIGGFDWTQVDTYVTLYEVIGQYYSAISELKSLSRWLLGREEDTFWNEVTENDCEWDVDESRKISVPGYVSGKHPSEHYELPLELRVKLGLYRLKIGDDGEAMHHLDFLDPQDLSGEHKFEEYSHLFHQAASELYKRGRFDKAMLFYEPLLSVPDYYDSALLVQIGRCLLRIEKKPRAEQNFRDAIELNENDVDARMELAKIHENRNELHKALNFVNEAMLLRRGQKKRKTAEEQNQPAGEEKVKKKYRPRNPKEPKEPKEASIEPKVPKMPNVEANKRLSVLSKGEELINHYQTLRSERDGMRAGDSTATAAWLEAAKALTDDFRSCKAFYPWDKYIRFLGYSGETALHAATPLDSDLTAIADRLSKNLGADISLHKKDLPGTIPTKYRDLPFTEWMNIFTEYALSLAKNGLAKESYEICHSIEDAVVFYQSREDKFLTHLVHSVCALISNDEEACVTQARFFMREYQFTTDAYRMYGALMRAIHSPVSWYSSGPSQKYILRQIKCMDLALIDEERRKRNNVGEKGSYSAVDDKGHLVINDDMDVCLLMMYGHILYVGQSYAYALNYFLRAYALDQNSPMINLCIGLTYCHHALKRQCENRQHHILQGMAFMMRYHESRITSGHLEERQEAHYNVARIYHMLGLVHLALPYYQKVLDEMTDGKRSKREDIVVDTAYNLQTMYALAGNMELAQEVTRKWLVI